MRRSEREVAGAAEKLAILDQCKVCRLALEDQGRPYIVPLNFGYSYEVDASCEADATRKEGALTLYFHGAHEGKKIDIIRHNNRACFEVDCEHKLLEAETACAYSYEYASVIGSGYIEFIEGDEEKKRALDILMKRQTGRDVAHTYSDAQLNAVCVYRLNVAEWSGKRHGVGEK